MSELRKGIAQFRVTYHVIFCQIVSLYIDSTSFTTRAFGMARLFNLKILNSLVSIEPEMGEMDKPPKCPKVRNPEVNRVFHN
jgi:hypothetical protein